MTPFNIESILRILTDRMPPPEGRSHTISLTKGLPNFQITVVTPDGKWNDMQIDDADKTHSSEEVVEDILKFIGSTK